MNTANKYFVTIGLEIHAELNTQSKMWCSCANVPLEEVANKNVCAICMAHPGSLPVANNQALYKMIQIGLSVRNEADMSVGAYKNVSNFIEFDRKNYFYPDIPKAYQITQYQYPIINSGVIAPIVDGLSYPISLTRIHLEEDTAKSTHDKGDYTLIDFNRAGVPLMELVTDAHTYDNAEIAAKVSSEFARELRRILRTLGAGDANMEKGQMRVEANISVTEDKDNYGTKCEVKNLNSFRSVEDAIKYEVDRHIELIESGGKVLQETRGWDENKRSTFSQRKKENAHDYRYFPDPDLPKIYTYEMYNILDIMKTLPLLPSDRRSLWNDIGLQDKHIIQMLDDVALGDYYLECMAHLEHNDDKKSLANYLLTDAVGIISTFRLDGDNKYEALPTTIQMVDIINMIKTAKLSSRGAKDLLSILIKDWNINKDKKVEAIAEENNLIQKNDDTALLLIVDKVINDSPKEWAEYKAGNDKLLMYFVGQSMKESRGSGNPTAITNILKNI